MDEQVQTHAINVFHSVPLPSVSQHRQFDWFILMRVKTTGKGETPRGVFANLALCSLQGKTQHHSTG